MPPALKRIAILVGAVILGLAVLSLLVKGLFFLFRLAIVAAVVVGAALVIQAAWRAWQKSRCEKCSRGLTLTEYVVSMPIERARALVDAGSIDVLTALFRPRESATSGELIAKVRTCKHCGGTTWITLLTPSGEVLFDEQRAAPGLS